MSNDLQKLLDLINDTSVDENCYVFFDQEGDIVQVGSDNNSPYDKIKMPIDNVVGIMSGKERMCDYTVLYNPLIKEYELHKKNKVTNEDILTSNLYETPIKNVEIETAKPIDEDLLIVQNIREKCWKVKISNKGIDRLFKINPAGKQIHLSITAKHDPNILYKRLVINSKELIHKGYVVLPFHDSFEFTNIDISIFTAKIFDTYCFERILQDEEI
jgi:hypothetical protein